MGKIFYIMGKSGTGKDTIKKLLIEITKNKYENFEEIIPCTTRPKRYEEVEDVDYHFVTEEHMREDESYKDILEMRSYNTVNGIWYYYTRKSDIDLINHNYITIGTIESFKTLKLALGEDNIVPIYIYASQKQRLLWMIKREELNTVPCYKEICRRYMQDEEDFTDKKLKKAGIDENHMFYNEEGYALFLADTLFHSIIEETLH